MNIGLTAFSFGMGMILALGLASSAGAGNISDTGVATPGSDGKIVVEADQYFSGEVDTSQSKEEPIVVTLGGQEGTVEFAEISAPDASSYTITGDVSVKVAAETIAVPILILGLNTTMIMTPEEADSVRAGTLEKIIFTDETNILNVFGDTVSIAELTLAGGLLFADPAFVGENGELQEKSRVALGKIGAIDGQIANGSVISGQNSQIAIGTVNTDWLDTQATAAGWKEDGTGPTAALGLYGAHELLDSASIGVDGNVVAGTIGTADPGTDPVFEATDGGNAQHATAAIADNSVVFAKNSLLVVQAKDHDGDNDPAILKGAGTDTSTITVAANSKLYVVEASLRQVIKITEGFDLSADTAIANGAWGTGNNTTGTLLFDNYLLTGVSTETAPGQVVIKKIEAKAPSEVFGNMSASTMGSLHRFMVARVNDTDSDDVGVRFVSRVLSRSHTRGDTTSAAINIEGANQLAAIGGVQGTTNTILTKMADLTAARALKINVPAFLDTTDIWVTPFYSVVEVEGLKSGRFNTGYESSLAGMAIGADRIPWENIRVGVAMNLGSGDNQSTGDFYQTDNDFDFWGLAMYNSYTHGNIGFHSDLTYQMSSNQITQKNYALGGLQAEVGSSALSLGLTGRYRFNVDPMDIIPHLGILPLLDLTPHLGLRYTSLSSDSYKTKSRAGDLNRVAEANQDILTVPLGVTLSSSFDTDRGWTVSPRADLGLILAAGELAAKSSTEYGGVNFNSMVEEVVSPVNFTGAIGVSATNDQGVSLGLDYNLTASGAQSSHGFSGMLKFQF